MEQSRGAGAKRRKIETGIGALDLLELLLGFLQVLHAAGGGAFVWVPSLQSNWTENLGIFFVEHIF
jgi:hypothetical protein